MVGVELPDIFMPPVTERPAGGFNFRRRSVGIPLCLSQHIKFWFRHKASDPADGARGAPLRPADREPLLRGLRIGGVETTHPAGTGFLDVTHAGRFGERHLVFAFQVIIAQVLRVETSAMITLKAKTR